ncbi:choice-of-anchor J domain-containing protein [Winogradskyella endarachnes]|uniref:DUF5017 domain-containing protein n=1 Tax=Winogradskyella endarachnes TaxID=2681965 RepID=A0A6L6U8E5_9FLAO|nr:choice-of-anchor J domain-containing protein [Winogradskyella endarachnes]MUU78543.1 hypothetical protein [Winogradskyella endarachnes]
MKKVIYLLAFIGMAFVGCNPVEDIHNEIDSQDDSVVGEAEYTLTDDDYDALGLIYGTFDSEQQAKDSIPQLLEDLYPFWGNGSSVLVGYDLYLGSSDGVNDFVYADTYSLGLQDYPQGSLNAIAFYPNENPSDYIPNILASEIVNPTEGQIVLASYKQYTEEPVEGIANIYEADFVAAGTLLDYTAISVVGDQVWEGSSYGAKMSGYADSSSNINEDWLISAEIDLTGQVNPLFQVTQVLNYANELDYYNIYVSTDFTGDVTTATWDIIDVNPVPAGDSWTAVTSDDYSFSAYEGETIHIAFKYESDLNVSGTWEIELATIKVAGVEGETVDTEVYYTYTDGEWVLSEGVYILSEEDFESMGLSNFGSSIPADNYLPTFLSIKYPFAQEEDELIVIYKYVSSSSGAQLRGNLYSVVGGEWTGYESTISTTLQFGKEDGIWVPDNTIRYTVISSDYSLVASTLLTEPGFESAASNLDSYGNFNRTTGSSGWTDAQMKTAMGVILDNLDPNAEEGQKYIVTVDIYNGASGTEDFAVIKTDGVWEWQNPEDYDE